MRNPWPFAIIGAFVGVAAMGVVLLVLAGSPQLVESHPYEHGLNYDVDRAQLERAQALGWRLKVRWERGADGAQLVLAFDDRAAQPVMPERVAVNALRPSAAREDRELSCKRIEARSEYSCAPNLAQGLWILDVKLPAPGEDALFHEQVMAP